MQTLTRASIEEAIEQSKALAEGEDVVARFEVLHFEQVPFVVEHLRRCGTAIVDVREMDADEAQRVFDFCAGACEMLHDPIKGSYCHSYRLEERVLVLGQPEGVAELQCPKVVQMSDFRRLDR